MNLLTPDLGLIFWHTVTFLVVLLLLGKFAWKPILGSLKERELTIENALKSAEKAREEMSALQSSNEKLLQEARAERDRLMRDAQVVANTIKEEAKADAVKITNKMIEDARSIINAEKNSALSEIKSQVANLSLQIAEKIIRKNLSNDKSQKDLIDEYIKDLKVN